MYSDVLTQLSSHGYIVIGLDLDWPAATLNSTNDKLTAVDHNGLQLNEEPVKIYKAIEWVSRQSF